MTRFTRTVLTVAGAIALTAGPAFAQHRGGGHGGGASRGGGYARPSTVYRGGGYGYRGGVYSRGYYGGGHYGGGRYLRVGPTRFYRPYYTFRPRFSLGFGLYVGYPFAYNYGYYDPFAYDYPYPYSSAYPYPYDPYPYNNSSVYPYAPQGAYPPQGVTPPPQPNAVPPVSEDTITGQPDQANMGGLSFEISPSDAQIFVDGRPAGTAGQFTATSQPLGVSAGRHHVEIRANGYRTMSVDVDVVAGQVIPYQGTMER